ncbi:MAG TPA: hypothetical protein VGM50_06640 [Gemmatimonadaceae bacterium]|jgi:hypothetical protein
MSNTRSRTKRAAAPSARVAGIEVELDAWQKQALPDASTPLEAEDVARLVRNFVEAFGAADAGESFSVNTVHYYRRKDILDEPEGRTAAARYGMHHVWQAVGARLAGFLGLVTLAEARDVVRGAPDATLRRFVAERVADVRARAATREPAASDAWPLAANGVESPSTSASGATATVLALGGDALCLVPSDHPALQSRGAARALVDALARALGVHKS